MGTISIYEGESPYIFISYAHANSPAVMQVVEDLAERGYRIWYDDGIEVGSEWPEFIASHLAGASLMIAFLSNAYIRSDNCRKEMHYALAKKIPIINIFLEDTAMTPGMEMQIGNIFALMKYGMTESAFDEKLFSAPQLNGSLLDGNLTDLSAVKPLTKLAEAEISGCGLNELRAVFRQSSLTDVTLYDCDLRGRFFYSFDMEWKLVTLKLCDCKLNSTKNLEDFQGLTTLTLIRSGENLDWSGLASLPVLKNVYADATMEETLRPVLEGSRIELQTVT